MRLVVSLVGSFEKSPGQCARLPAISVVGDLDSSPSMLCLTIAKFAGCQNQIALQNSIRTSYLEETSPRWVLPISSSHIIFQSQTLQMPPSNALPSFLFLGEDVIGCCGCCTALLSTCTTCKGAQQKLLKTAIYKAQVYETGIIIKHRYAYLWYSFFLSSTEATSFALPPDPLCSPKVPGIFCTTFLLEALPRSVERSSFAFDTSLTIKGGKQQINQPSDLYLTSIYFIDVMNNSDNLSSVLSGFRPQVAA